MQKIWIYTILSVSIVSLISLIGIFFISLNEERLKFILLFMVSFSVGGLFGDAFIHLVPEAFKNSGNGLLVSIFIILGILVFFALEKFFAWRHCHLPTSEKHPHPIALMNLFGDGLHNLIDGMVIGASYLVSPSIGFTTTLAVIFHEIPQEIGDYSILIYGGFSKKRALLMNFLSALTAIVGAIISLLIGPKIESYSAFLIPLTAGGFIYLAGSDLIPELHKETKLKRSIWQFVGIVSGVGIMVLLLFFDL
ncbi:MAG: ZIP family metal transporter [bacterium]|nr:ZIP family metal transporter [bacterium]